MKPTRWVISLFLLGLPASLHAQEGGGVLGVGDVDPGDYTGGVVTPPDDAPKPGIWTSQATLTAIGVTQSHKGALAMLDMCGRHYRLEVPGQPPLELTRAFGETDYTGTSESQGCTTEWRLTPGAEEMTGGYRGSCQGMTMTADVVMQRQGALPADLAPEAPAGTPEDLERILDEAATARDPEARPGVSGTQARMAVAEAITGMSGAAAQIAMEPYTSTKSSGSAQVVHIRLDESDRPLLAERKLPDACAVPPGSQTPADRLLILKMFHHSDFDEHQVFGRVYDMAENGIAKASEGDGTAGRAGRVEAVREAIDGLGLDIDLPDLR